MKMIMIQTQTQTENFRFMFFFSFVAGSFFSLDPVFQRQQSIICWEFGFLFCKALKTILAAQSSWRSIVLLFRLGNNTSNKWYIYIFWVSTTSVIHTHLLLLKYFIDGFWSHFRCVYWILSNGFFSPEAVVVVVNVFDAVNFDFFDFFSSGRFHYVVC